ncbi:MAG: ABC transporter ATP-binding protein, partial [Pseudobutyrivibrio sp.]|nr:ABC transporter ATP-binding protein [Pseudobutyrivibrio sp.]
ITAAIFRGIFHYGEQYCNHYIAFSVLAIIRHKVFAALRSLCPAKLDGKDKGNLITMITTDVELLEVFFAHTISPVVIAFIVSTAMIIYIGLINPLASVIALLGYVFVGVIIPIVNGRASNEAGFSFRNDVGQLNSYVVDLAYGIDESIQYGSYEKDNQRLKLMSDNLAKRQKTLVKYEKKQTIITNIVIQLFSLFMLLLMIEQYKINAASISQVIITTVAMMSSFGPVIALSSLSNNLNQTLACGRRVLDLLDETPEVIDVIEDVEWIYPKNCKEKLVHIDNVSFSYKDKEVIKNKSFSIPRDSITGIHGPSGCGKSTFIRLLMRFWNTDNGNISYQDSINHMVDVNEINTSSLRANQSFVEQDTWIANDTIENNIRLSKPDASMKEIEAAADNASILDFIKGLPNGFDTIIGPGNTTLSSGEKQRIGLARAFLHNGSMLILDEPTSSLDALNEGVILKSIKAKAKDKTIILVSHRESTMKIADTVLEF